MRGTWYNSIKLGILVILNLLIDLFNVVNVVINFVVLLPLLLIGSLFLRVKLHYEVSRWQLKSWTRFLGEQSPWFLHPVPSPLHTYSGTAMCCFIL